MLCYVAVLTKQFVGLFGKSEFLGEPTHTVSLLLRPGERFRRHDGVGEWMIKIPSNFGAVSFSLG